MNQPTLITGGAGFIGSNLADAIIANVPSLRVIDNLSSGSLENLKQLSRLQNFTFVRSDLLNAGDALRAINGCEILYHLAANPEVRVSAINPKIHFKQNILATYNLLEAVRKTGSVKKFVFTSSSTVYGDASRIPTPEDYAPLKPISVYGSTKLACEAMVSAYAHTYGFNAVIYRLANIVGPRARHGVIYDFILKLRKNKNQLKILGDGKQTKSYLHVNDCIQAMLLGVEKARERVEVFNVGSENQVNVQTIAKIVAEEMGFKVKLTYTGGVDGGRGWVGDVRNVLLDIGKLKSLGWKPRFNSEQAIRAATKAILREIY